MAALPSNPYLPAINLSETPVTDKLDSLPDAVAAQAFRRLVRHLRHRTDAQNIDLMILAGFCRNCLSKWYKASADDQGLELDLDQAREKVYGMTYAAWKDNHQTEATPEQLAAMEKAHG